MSPEDYEKMEKLVHNFMEENHEVFNPQEAINEIIHLVRTEKEDDLLRLKLHVILQGFANKVVEFNKQQ